MRNADGSKWLTAERLIELLQALPPDSRVTPNTVGNLAVLTSDGAGYVGFVDFVAHGEVEKD